MKAVFITISILFLAYVVASALIIPFTADEVSTFIEFVRETSLWNTITMAHQAVNNHLLNSLLTRLCAQFSVHEFSLRLPNILSFLLYLYGSYKIAITFFQNKYLQVCFFLALLGNNYMLHFFAYSRGYGLSIGLFLFSISNLVLFTKDTQFDKKKVHLCLLFSVLSVYASFTTIFVCLASMVFTTIAIYQKQGTRSLKSFITAAKLPFLYFMLLVALCAYPIYRLMQAEEFEYGGTKGFIGDTLTSVSEDLFHINYGSGEPVGTILFYVILASLLIVTISFLKNRTKKIYYYAGPFILAFCMAAITAQSYIMHSKFIMHRTAVYLYPLIILTLFSSIAVLNERFFVYKKIAVTVISSVIIFFLIKGINFLPTVDWWCDAHTKEVLSYIIKDATPTANKKIKLFAYDDCSNSFKYYIDTRYSNIIEPTPWRVKDLTSIDLDTFQYLYLRDIHNFKQKSHFEPILHYEDSWTIYKKK
jgi:hypothetical protein